MAFDLNNILGTYVANGKSGKAFHGNANISGDLFGALTQVTIEGWVRGAANGSKQLAMGGGSNPGFGMDETGNAMGMLWAPGDHYMTTTTPINDGALHHLAVTIDTATVAKFYVDGVLRDTRNGTCALTSNVMGIGNQAGYGKLFEGDMDEFAVTSGIKYTGNFTPAVTLNNQSNLIALWHFEDDGINSAGLAVADSTPPVASSAAVANGAPTIVAITMSEAMDGGFVPAASAFTVSGHTVSSVAISSTVINLTCSAGFVNGEAARTVAYTQPGTNQARDVAGNLLANFSGLAITNNVSAAADTTAPTIVSASVPSSTPNFISVFFSENLADSTPPNSAHVLSGGRTATYTSVYNNNMTVQFTPPLAYGETLTYGYNKPGTNPRLQDAAGNAVESISGQAVTNNVAAAADTTPPAFASAQVANSQPAVILVTMNETLAASVPPASAFTASGGRTVTGVSITGTVVSVTVNTPYAFGDTITIAYTQPGANPRLQDAAGNLTATFAAQAVTNNIAAIPDAPRYARPMIDISKGAWQASTGTDLYAVIDEATFDSTDYISTSTASSCEIKLGPITDPGTSSGQIVRYAAHSPGGSNLTVTLKQGATTIASRVHANLPTTATVHELVLTTQQCDAITNYRDLRLVFTVN